jgi:prepilin-type N-terminal cleavage/methylation domain-containing protein
MMKPEQAGRAGRQAGYTLAEVLVAVGLAGIILAGAVYLFGQSMDVSTIVSLRGEMQQNARVGINLIYRDLSVAGTGLPNGGVQLPFGAAVTIPQLGCDMTLTCWVKAGGSPGAAALNYYQSLNGGSTYNSWLYWINPQDGQGPSVSTPNTGGSVDRDPWSTAAGVTLVPTDVITIVYKDNNYPTDWQYPGGGACSGVTNPQPATQPPYVTNGCSWSSSLDQWPVASINIAGTPTTVTFQNSNPGIADPEYGLNNGDILMFSNSNGAAVGVVTSVVAATNTVDLATTGDPLNFNQVMYPSSGSVGIGGLSSIQNFSNASPPAPLGFAGLTTKAFRIIVVTYYIDNNTNPGFPRLMRQVNALPPTPVAQNIENLQFSYDVFDTNANVVCPNIANPYNPATACSTGAYYSPNQIGKVNIFLQARAATQRLVGRGYSRVSMISAVTPRNMDFSQRY